MAEGGTGHTARQSDRQGNGIACLAAQSFGSAPTCRTNVCPVLERERSPILREHRSGSQRPYRRAKLGPGGKFPFRDRWPDNRRPAHGAAAVLPPFVALL